MRKIFCAASAILLLPGLFEDAKADGAVSSKLLISDVCPSKKNVATESFLGTLLVTAAPKIVQFGANLIDRIAHGAAEKAKKNRTKFASADSVFDFYVYSESDPSKVVHNPQAGCLIFAHGEIGGNKSFSGKSMSALNSLKDDQKIGATPNWDHDANRTEYGYEDYFADLGFSSPPYVYVEMQLEPALTGKVSQADVARDYFQLRPIIFWYRKSIGTKAPDRKPDVGIGFTFNSIITHRADWKIDEMPGYKRSIGNKDQSTADAIFERTGDVFENFPIAFTDITPGTIMGPDALEGFVSKPIPNYPIPDYTLDANALKSVTWLQDEHRYYEARKSIEALKAKSSANTNNKKGLCHTPPPANAREDEKENWNKKCFVFDSIEIEEDDTGGAKRIVWNKYLEDSLVLFFIDAKDFEIDPKYLPDYNKDWDPVLWDPDPKLNDGKYKMLAHQDICDTSFSFMYGCRTRTKGQLKAEALGTVRKAIKTRQNCYVTAMAGNSSAKKDIETRDTTHEYYAMNGEKKQIFHSKDPKFAAALRECDRALSDTVLGWEIRKRKALHAFSKFDSEFMDMLQRAVVAVSGEDTEPSQKTKAAIFLASNADWIAASGKARFIDALKGAQCLAYPVSTDCGADESPNGDDPNTGGESGENDNDDEIKKPVPMGKVQVEFFVVETRELGLLYSELLKAAPELDSDGNIKAGTTLVDSDVQTVLQNALKGLGPEDQGVQEKALEAHTTALRQAEADIHAFELSLALLSIKKKSWEAALASGKPEDIVKTQGAYIQQWDSTSTKYKKMIASQQAANSTADSAKLDEPFPNAGTTPLSTLLEEAI